MIVVADASFCIKWLFQDSADEPGAEQTIELAKIRFTDLGMAIK